MKKRLLLIVCCVLVLVFCTSALFACKDKDALDEATLELLLTAAKGNVAATGNVTADFTLSATVSSYDEAADKMLASNIKWSTNAAGVELTTANNETTVKLPASRAEDLVVTLTGTLVDADGKAYKRADGTEFTFTITRTAKATNPAIEAQNNFFNKIITNPQVGTTYKLATFKQYAAWYFDAKTRATSNNRLATTMDYATGTDVKLEAADEAGKYYITFVDGTATKYLDLYADYATSSSGGYNLAKTAIRTNKADVKGLFMVHATGGLYTTTTASNGETLSYYLCMRNSQMPEIYGYDIKSLNSDGWKTTDNAMVLVAENISYTAPEISEAEVLAMAQALAVGEEIPGRVSLTGTVKSAVDMTVTMDVNGVEIVAYGMVGRANVKANDRIKVTGVITNYNDKTAGKNMIEFISGCTYEMIQRAPVEVPSNVDRVDAPVADTAYLMAINQENLVKQIYLTAEMNGYYVQGTEDRFGGVKFYVEAAGNGFKIYRLVDSAKTYLGVTTNDTHVNLSLDHETVWTIDNTGIHATVGEGSDATEYYIGTNGTYTTVGMYRDGDTVWKAYLGTLKADKANAAITVKDDANATITVDKTSAAIGETVNITVTPKNDYTLNSVLVNGKAIEAVEGVYSFVVEADSEVSVILNDPSGEAPKGTQANPYTVAEAIAAAPASGYSSEIWVEGYAVTGSQAAIPTLSRNQWLFYLSDTVGGTGIQIRYANHDGIEHLYLNDKVLVKGLLTKYNGDVQMAYSKDIANSNPTLVQIITVGMGSIQASEDNAKGVTVTFTTPTAVDGVITAVNGTEIKFTVNVDVEGKVLDAVIYGNVVDAEEGVYTVTLNGNMKIIVTLKDKVEEDPSKKIVTLTTTAMKLTNGAYSSKDPTAITVDGMALAYIGLGNYGDGLQWRYNNKTTGTSTVYNTASLGRIESIKFVPNAKQASTTKTNHLKLEYGSTDQLGSSKIITLTNEEVVITFEAGTSYEYFRIVNNNNGAVYVDSIVITIDLSESASDNEAKIGETEYATLAEAITAAKAAEGQVTITLLKDVSSGGIALWEADNANIVLDLNNHTLTLSKSPVGSSGTESQGLHLEKNNTVVIKNGTITSVAGSGIKMLINNYCNLTLDKVTLDGSNLDGTEAAYTLSNNFGTTLIKNGSVIKARAAKGVALDVWYGMSASYEAGLSVTVETGCTINGAIEYGAHSRVTGTDWIEKAVLVLPAGDYAINYTCDSVTDANANITIGGVKIGEVNNSETPNA